jgi:FkbM family methyltransferase
VRNFVAISQIEISGPKTNSIELVLENLKIEGSFLPQMTTFAQNFEDVMLRRALLDVKRGFYIDIGAFDPIIDSVTNWFYSQGWRGINIEPNPEFHRKLEVHRPHDRNICLAVNKVSGMFPFIFNDGLSALAMHEGSFENKAAQEGTKWSEVEGISLDEVFQRYVEGSTVDFLKIDAEGAEAAILSSSDFKDVRPRILLVEATKPNSRTPNWVHWEDDLIRRGYSFCWFDGLNRFYVREEDIWRRELLSEPPSVFDNFMFSPNDRRISLIDLGCLNISELVTLNKTILSQLTEVSDGLKAFKDRNGKLENENKDLRAVSEALEIKVARLQIKESAYRQMAGKSWEE